MRAASSVWLRRVAIGASASSLVAASRYAPTAAEEQRTVSEPSSQRTTTDHPPLPPPESMGLRKDAFFSCWTATGERVSMAPVLAAAERADALLLGETHDDPVAHQLELYLLIALTQRRPTSVSLEMFEADVQSVVDEYLGGLIREEDFLMDARPWANYESDYRSLIEFAKQETLPVLAANVPRRYVGAAGRQRGNIDDFSWPLSARPWLPPLPLPRPSAGYMAHLLNDLAVVRTDELGFSLDTASEAASDGVVSSPRGGASWEGAAGVSGSGVASKKGAGCPYLGVRRQDGLLAPMLLWDARMAHAIATRLEQVPRRSVTPKRNAEV